MDISPSRSSLDKAVRGVLAEGRVGRPSFVRAIARAEAGNLEGELKELVALTDGWFDGRPVARFRQGHGSDTYRTEMLKWAQGEGALLIVSSAPQHTGPALDLMVIGSAGTIYFEE